MAYGALHPSELKNLWKKDLSLQNRGEKWAAKAHEGPKAGSHPMKTQQSLVETKLVYAGPLFTCP